MQAPPKSRGPSGFHAFPHIAQRGVPFITVGAQTFGCHTSVDVRTIHRFASQNLSPSPQPQAEKGLTHAHEIHSTLGFCVTTPPAPDAFLGSLKLPTSPPLPPRHHKIKTQISGPGTVTFDSPTHTMTHVLNPNTVKPIPAGRSLTFTTLATDAAGTPVPNAPVTLMVGGAHSLQLNGITGADGQVSFNYAGANPGTDTVQALGTVTGMFALSNQVTVTWGTPTPTPPSTPPPGLSLTVAGAKLLTLPDPAVYTATATDPGLPAGATIAISWIQLSGPATVTFATPQQAVTSVTFPVPGVYMLQATATDSLGAQATPVGPITVEPPDVRSLSAGWLNAIVTTPATGLIPIALNPGVTLTGGTLVYYPEQNFNGLTELDPAKMTVFNPNTTGSGTLATLDTTLLSNGPYYILLEATDSTGKTMGSGLEVLVGGDYKPGRVTTTVTDLVVPAPGLPIQIQRTYDSLTRATSSDFGNGWALGVNVQLSVSSTHDVTLTLNGQKRTFYFTPYVPGFQLGNMNIPNMLSVYFPAYTGEPGMYGTLTLGSDGSNMVGSTGCLFDWMLKYENIYFCYDNAGTYNPEVYVYTDPYGRVYTIGGDGSLRSITDLAGNTLTVTPNGIVSSNGLNVPFVRDAQGRITQITDPKGNVYQYGYDAAGNLSSVTYPGVTTSAQYTYDLTHLYKGGTDPRGNALPSTTYDAVGRLQSVTQSVTDAKGQKTSQKTSYVYDTVARSTQITYPDMGTATLVYDAYGKLLTATDPLGHTTTNVYDANHNLTSVTDPLGHTTAYTYDSNGNRTSVTSPSLPASHTTYNAYSEPATTTDELGNVRTFTYDANFWPNWPATRSAL